MGKRDFEKHRYILIAIIVALMGALILVVGESLRQVSSYETVSHENAVLSYGELKSEAGMFKGWENPSRFAKAPQNLEKQRNLKNFYERREYPGSPPFIPHKVVSDMQDKWGSCLSCHKEGGYVAVFKSYAPVTPHPEFVNCRQCHVSQKTDQLFRDTLWESVIPPKIRRSALPGSPPPIPHSLQMRENCLSCHSGPAAVKEIRTPHPERINCRQCHVSSRTKELFIREGSIK